MNKLSSEVAISNSPNKTADVKVETGELSMEELGNVAAGSLTQDSVRTTLATNPTIMKTKHDTVKNSISNVR